MIWKRSKKPGMEEKILDVDASIQGNMVFNDPVNLKINGKFEGNLKTKGFLSIGEKAEVSADIIGENIVVAGRVIGDIIAEKSLRLASPAKVVGNIKTPHLAIEGGALLNGNCQMIFDEAQMNRMQAGANKNILSIEEVARYLDVEPSVVAEWAASGRLRGRKENDAWRFERVIIDEWVKNEKIK